MTYTYKNQKYYTIYLLCFLFAVCIGKLSLLFTCLILLIHSYGGDDNEWNFTRRLRAHSTWVLFYLSFQYLFICVLLYILHGYIAVCFNTMDQRPLYYLFILCDKKLLVLLLYFIFKLFFFVFNFISVLRIKNNICMYVYN